MENERTGEFSESAKAPAVMSVVLEAWWRIAPGDLVDILLAAAGADLLAGTFGGRRISQSDAAYQPGGTDGLDPNASEAQLTPTRSR
jgi:hypothetical protein